MIKADQFSVISKDFKRVITPGAFEIFIGGGQPTGATSFVNASTTVTGDQVLLDN